MLALALAGLAGCSGEDGRSLPPPPPPSSTTTTEPIDFTQVSLPAVNPGKEPPVTKPPGGGRASIGGRVLDDHGAPVPGALVRATYYGDPDAPEVIEALAGDDGGYRFGQVYGGRWRLRAWLAPTHATLEVPAFFLGATEQKTLDLKVKVVPGLAVTSDMAPDPPLMGELAELAVLVVNQSVDGEGRVTRTPAAAVPVALSVVGSWSLRSANPQITDSSGTATWTVVCRAAGQQSISAALFNEYFPLSLPACLDPASTTTTTTTTTTAGETTGGAPTASTRPRPRATTTTRAQAASSAGASAGR